MRRPVMYLVGLLMATGASLALAGPAAAAPAHNDYHHKCHHGHHTGWWDGNYSDNDYYSYDRQNSFNNGNHYNGINVLNGVIGGGGLI